MLAIKNNLMASNAARHLGKSYDSLARSVERLSSGLRINSAKDDAAGLAVRELIRADVAVLQQGSRNASDGISMLQTMEGAMGVIDESLIRMKELAEQAATGSYSDAQRLIMNSEFSEMANEIDRIANSTKFNGNALLNTGSGSYAIHVGTSETIAISSKDMNTQSGALNITVGSAGYEAVSSYGISSATNTWLTITDADATGGDMTLSIQFTDADADDETLLEVYFTGVASDSNGGVANFTLTEVVEAINAVSLNLPKKGDGTIQAYTAAEVSHDNDTGNNFLKVSSRTGIADALSMSYTANTGQTCSNGFKTVTNLMTNELVGAAGTGINIATAAAALTALTRLDTAITTKDTARAEFGYKMNRLESTIAILDIQSENLMAAESRVSDVDVSTEMAALTRTQVLAQAGIAMLAQANTMPQMALTLLR